MECSYAIMTLNKVKVNCCLGRNLNNNLIDAHRTPRVATRTGLAHTVDSI